MAEWLKAAVLKTVVPRGTVGSNPTPSARKNNLYKAWHKTRGEMAETAEGARLLSEYGAKVPSRVRIPLSPPFSSSSPCD